jgi:F1F0 ATPase subunit 2
MLPEAVMLAFACAGGGLLGLFFFGGLWWTVQKGISAAQPGLWFSASLLVRTGVVLTGFYLVGNDHWQRMLLCLVGFSIARPIVGRLTRTLGQAVSPPRRESPHAP